MQFYITIPVVVYLVRDDLKSAPQMQLKVQINDLCEGTIH